MTFFFSCLLHFQVRPLPLPSEFSLAKQKLLPLCLLSPLPSQVISQGSAEFLCTEPFVSAAINTNGEETLLDLGLISRGMSWECEGSRLVWERLGKNEIHNSSEEKKEEKPSEKSGLIERENSHKEQE